MSEQDPKTVAARLKRHATERPAVNLTVTFPDDRSPAETFSLPSKGSGAVKAAKALNRLLSKCVKVG